MSQIIEIRLESTYDTNIGKRAFEATNVTEPFHFKALYFLKFKLDRLDNCRYRFAI